MIFLRAIAVWLLFISAESLNGTLRELWLVPALGAVPAHQLSFVIGSLVILAIATLFSRWLQTSRFSQLLQIGFLWVLLTLGFEVGLGRFLGYSWKHIVTDYNPTQGGLMIFGLGLLLVAPMIAAKLRNIVPTRNQLT